MNDIPKNIIISRTDSIGDVILTLPVAKVLKDYYPGIKIAFLGKAYTKPVINACKYVDEFIDVKDFLNAEKSFVCDELAEAILHVFPVASIAKKAKRSGIALRIGTTNRLYHWLTCNKLVRLSRKNSLLHEAQLNLRLLEPFGIDKIFSLKEIVDSFGLENLQPQKPVFLHLLNPGKFHLIIHPKSQGSGREWGFDNYISLIQSLDERYQIFISGTEKEHSLLQPLLSIVENRVTDISGVMELDQFISFINHCDGLVAGSTGPLHIAAALDKYAFGIFPPIRPLHPGRWGPVGKKAKSFVLNKECIDCIHNKKPCHCIQEVQPAWIKKALDKASAGD